MTLYAALVFVHVLGAIGMFAAWTMEALGLTQLAAADAVDAVPRWLAMRRRRAMLGGASMLAAIITGVVMMVMRGMQPWMPAAIGEVVLIIAVAIVVERRIAPRLATFTANPARASHADMAIISRAMSGSLRFRVVTGVAIVALMTLKPGLSGTLELVAAGIAIGAIIATRSAGRRGRPAAA